MAAPKKKDKARARGPVLVRKSLMIDPAKLARCRKVTGASTDAEVVRVALDHLLSHFPVGSDGEE